MRCRLSPTADVPSHTSGAAMCQQPHARQQLVAITSSGYNKSASFRLRADSYFLRGSSAELT